MEFDFSDASQQIFEDLAGKEEEKRQVSEDTAMRVAKDNAQSLFDKVKVEFSEVMTRDKDKFSSIGSGFKKAENYSDVVEEIKKEEKRDEEKRDYYSSGSSYKTKTKFGSSSSTSSTSSEERKAKAIDSYVTGLRDELDSAGKSIKNSIKAEAALYELERKVENDSPWTIMQLKESHDRFVSTGGGRYVTKESKKAITKAESQDLRKLKKEFARDKNILGFIFGGIKLWND